MTAACKVNEVKKGTVDIDGNSWSFLLNNFVGFAKNISAAQYGFCDSIASLIYLPWTQHGFDIAWLWGVAFLVI